jgi:hypothetical protein
MPPSDAGRDAAARLRKERIMIKGRLLASVCALGLMVAAPAFAAGMDNNPSGSTINGSSMNSGPSMNNNGGNWQHGAASGSDMRNGGAANAHASADMNKSRSAADNSGNGSMNGMRDHAANDHAGNMRMKRSHSAMNQDRSERSRQAMRRRGGNDTSQNADVDRLNDQSLQAAKQGHPFMTGSSNGSDQGQGMHRGQGSQPGNAKM